MPDPDRHWRQVNSAPPGRCEMAAQGRMSIELKPVQVRLNDEAYRALVVVAKVNDQDLGEAARIIVTEALLGKSHAIKVLAERFTQATRTGNER
jgi:hypothetical protein